MLAYLPLYELGLCINKAHVSRSAFLPVKRSLVRIQRENRDLGGVGVEGWGHVHFWGG